MFPAQLWPDWEPHMFLDTPGLGLGLLALPALPQLPWKIGYVKRLPYLPYLTPILPPGCCLVPAADGDPAVPHRGSTAHQGSKIPSEKIIWFLIPASSADHPPSFCSPLGGRRGEQTRTKESLAPSPSHGLLGKWKLSAGLIKGVRARLGPTPHTLTLCARRPPCSTTC